MPSRNCTSLRSSANGSSSRTDLSNPRCSQLTFRRLHAMMGYIEVFRHDDQTNSRLYRATHPLTLRRAHWIVDGYVEAIPHWVTHLHNDGILYDACALCNEDGKGKGLPINRLATARWAQ